jgi:hypothetical protein
MAASRCLIVLALAGLAGCATSRAPDTTAMTRPSPIVVSALNASACAEVDAYSAACIGD